MGREGTSKRHKNRCDEIIERCNRVRISDELDAELTEILGKWMEKNSIPSHGIYFWKIPEDKDWMEFRDNARKDSPDVFAERKDQEHEVSLLLQDSIKKHDLLGLVVLWELPGRQRGHRAIYNEVIIYKEEKS